MNRGHERAAPRCARAIVLGASLLATLAGCKQPVIGEPATSGQEVGGAKIEITGATVDGTGHVVASLKVTKGGLPVATPDEVAALKPMFTLAALSTHPVDGLPEWRSFLLTGSQTIPSLPLDAPGSTGSTATPPLSAQKQPGAEATGTLSGADGTFTYAYATAVPSTACPAPPTPQPLDRQCYDPAETLRAGAWLMGNGTADGTSTFDFRPDGGALKSRDVARYENCLTCHDAVRSPKGAVGVKICTTCHTWQNADPDTADPAAMWPADKAVDPNPLDFGRMVHRIHRGKELPTLYTSTSAAAAAPLNTGATYPLPFEPLRGGVPARNTPIPGRKYSIVGLQSREFVFGRSLNAYPADPTLPPKAIASGGVFPRDLRDCVACHQGALQGNATIYAISRRTCAGCHPDAWFGAAAITDSAKLSHIGGVQNDDTQCRGCHVAATQAQPKVYAPIAEIHVAPYKSPRWDSPTVEILSVDNLKPDVAPTIRFKLYDRGNRLIVPSPGAPVPALETGAFASPTPRKLTSLSITMAGPTSPGYWGFPVLSGDVVVPANPSILTLVADADGVYTYQFSGKLPATATGTWAVGMDGRRRYGPGAGLPMPFYDPVTDTFPWPYTGEIFGTTEQVANTVVYVDTTTGSWTPDAPGGAVPRRVVVSQEKCNRCHDHLFMHGAIRNKVQYCVLCHAPYRTDWAQRQAAAGQNVSLGATYDGVEERSIDLKMMVHRIHSGKREGSASLEAIEPFIVYGVGKAPFWLGEGAFPNDLRNCTVCHEGQSYRLDVMPADAPPSVANETSTILHDKTREHRDCPRIPPVRAACISCHATGFTETHAEEHTVDGVEQCASCHVQGAQGVDIAHGLAKPSATLASASFGSLVQNVLVPRCASAACHGGATPAAFPRLDAEGAYDAIYAVDSRQASGVKLVAPYDPAGSYLLLKMRGEAASVGGIATPMPVGDAMLDASELAAFEAWILNGAPND